MATKKSEFKINKGFIYQKVGKNIIIFNSEKSELLTFNETASFVFLQIKKGFSQSEILEKIVKKYVLSKSKADKDIIGLIRKLKKYKIII